MDEANCITLVNQLCEALVDEHISQQNLKKLKLQMISQIFTRRNSKDKTNNDELEDPISLLKSMILLHALKNRKKDSNYSETIDQMYNLLEQIKMEVNDIDIQNDIFMFLYLLTDKSTTNTIVENKINKIPIAQSNRLYSNIIEYEGMNWEVFNNDPSPIIATLYERPFYEEPGHGIPLLNDNSLDLKSFYSGKTELYSNMYKIWRFDLNQKVEAIAQDEGFVTPGSDFSEVNSVNEEVESQSTDSLSETDFEPNSLQPLKLRWDRLGNHEPFHELPFCSESFDSVINFWKIANSSQGKGLRPNPIGAQISFDELLTDIKYLLFDVGSPSFYFNEETKLFEMRDRLHTKSLTPELLVDTCKPFIKCANCYHSLKTFAETRIQMSFGCVHHIFCKCVQQILHTYKYCLLKMEWDNIRYLTQLQTLILPLERKLSFLTKICFISIEDKVTNSPFPSGIQLLDYLYTNLAKVCGSDLGYMMYYMFESCCNAYLRIVSEWIFDGCFSNPDNYVEFFIEIRREYEMCRDWKRVSCIGIKDKKVPIFLEKFYKEIFVCGKSLNLLKICSSQEILENLMSKEHPKLICCFNKKQIHSYIEQWRAYKSECEEYMSSNIRIKNKLLGTCDNPEFYAEVQRIKGTWFDRKEGNDEISNLDQTSDQSVTESKPEKGEKTELEELEKKVESPILKELDLEIDENSDEPKLEETMQSKNEQPKENEPSTPKMESLNPEVTKPKIKISFKMSENPEENFGDYQFRKTTPSNLPNNESTLNQPNTLGSGDGLTFEKKRVKQLISAIEQKIKSPSKTILGGGDGPCEKTPDVLKEIGNVQAQSEFHRNKLKAMGKLNSPVEEAIKKCEKPLTVCQENKFKLMTSDFNNRLNDSGSDEISKVKPFSILQENKLRVMSSRLSTASQEDTPKIKKTELSVCDKNRVKVMSSELHKRLNESMDNEPIHKPKENVVLSACEENKLKIMSSEYHNRLNESLKESSQKPVEKPIVLSALQENKRKVMYSEYHHRLSTPTPEKVIKHEKPMTACDENRLKVMSSEYHIRLQNSSQNINSSIAENSEPKLTACDENRSKAMSSEYHIRLKNSNQNISKSVPENPELESTKRLQNLNENIDQSAPKNLEHELNDLEKTTLIVLPNEYRDRLNETEIEKIEHISITAENESTSIEDESENSKKVQFAEIDETIQPSHPQHHFFPQNLINFNFHSLDDLNIESISDVDTTSLVYYLSQSIAVPLKIQLKLVNEAILRVFIEEECYLDHLISLRDYLLLRKPEFAMSLTNSIFKFMEKNQKPHVLFNNYNLSVILQRALLASGTRETLNYGRKLSLVAEDGIPETFTLVDIEELHCLNMNYSIKWPINILITEPILKKYCRIFKLLMKLQRVLWTLKKDFISLKNLKLGKSIQFTQIQIFRHNMTQIVKILQEHMMREAIETCWNEFVNHLITTEIDLDELYLSHLKYINKTMQRCFLCDQTSTCHQSILNMFSVILKYHEALKAGSWRRNVEVDFLYHTNFRNINSIYEEFMKTFHVLRCNLRTLVYNQQKTYFESLYLELSKNFDRE